jgi:hypothetical protein
MTGVTTLLEPPDVNTINTTVIGAEDYELYYKKITL